MLNPQVQQKDPTKNDFYDLYENEIDKKGDAVNAEKVRINRRSKCVGFVLAFLAIIAAVGGASLIAVSGGPTNQMFFFPGVACGVGTIIFSLWFAVEVLIAGKKRHNLDKELTEVKNTHCSYDQILIDMEKTNFDADQVYNILKKLEPEQREKFNKAVCNRYYEQKENKKNEILKAIARFPKDLAEFYFEGSKPEFACDILSHISSTQESHLLIVRLIKIVNKQPGTEKTLALHLQKIVALYQEDSNEFSSDQLVAIYKEMDVKQKTHFLFLMKDDKTQVVNRCVKETLTAEFGKSFEQEEESDRTNLVKQLAKFPGDCALAILENKQAWQQEKMLKTLWNEMTRGERDKYVQQVALQLDVDFMKKVIDHYKTPENLPEVFLNAIAKTPILFAKLKKEIGAEDKVIQEAFKLMSAEDKKLLYGIEEKEYSSLFKQRLEDSLKSPPNNTELSKPDNFLVYYFNKNPKELKKSVVDNKTISNDVHKRRLFALDILEYMEEKALQEALLNIDVGFGYVGVDNFADMMKVLVAESKATPPLRETREKLIARFATSQNVNDIRKSTIPGRKSKIPAENSDDWKKVLEIVNKVNGQQ